MIAVGIAVAAFNARVRETSLARIARVFATISATSFGGAQVAHMRRAIVGENRWLSEHEFVEMLAVAQVVPGSTPVSLAVLIGEYLRGTLGATVALVAATVPGFAILMLFAVVLFGPWHIAFIGPALRGCAAAAVGITVANCLELTRTQSRQWLSLAFLAGTALAVSLLHASLELVLFTFGLGSIAIQLATMRRS